MPGRSQSLCPEPVADLPRISVVTPSLNQGAFLEQAMRSVLLQEYPNLEYVVIDGGSHDNSLDLIRSYASWLSFWHCGPDQGMYDAIAKGFAHTSGDIMAWLNADDLYDEGCLCVVGEIFSRFPQIRWLTTIRPFQLDAHDRLRRCRRLPGFSKAAFRKAEYFRGSRHVHTAWIPQEATFWRRSLWEQAGGRFDSSLTLAGDYELWTRFYARAELYGVDAPLAGFRKHKRQKTAVDYPAYEREAYRVMARGKGEAHGFGRGLARKVVSRFPRWFLRAAQSVHLAYPGAIVVRCNGNRSWKIVKTGV